MHTGQRLFLLGLGIAGLTLAPAVRAATIVVTDANPAGWEIANFDDGTAADTVPPGTPTASGTQANFVTGPATPPAAKGSLRERVGTNGNDATRIRTSALNGTLLTALTNIQYSTWVTANVGGQATYIQLRIDLDANGTTDDILFFEPVYQNGTYSLLGYSGPVPNQCGGNPGCITLSTWQTWDADIGGWWSNNDSAGGPPLTTLAGYAANYPGARLATDSAALRLTAGFGAGAWDNFDGNVDALTIGGSTYDFEACSPGPLYVDDTGGSDASNDCQTIGTPCATVQHAVDMACAGATINVAAGSYPEIVTIPRSVRVVGAGKASTTLQAPGSLPPSGVIVTVTGISTSAEIENLTVAGPGASGCGSIRAGIFVRDGAFANIHDNAIRDVRDAPLSGCQNGLGILVGSGSLATTGSATIQNNEITTYQKGGIVVANTGSSATIDGNTVTGIGNTPLIAQNGIQVSGGATGQVTGNDVSDNRCDHPSCGLNGSQSAGILLFDHGLPMTVSGNAVADNDMGIYHFTTDVGATAITNNDVTGSRFEGVFLDEGTAALTGNTVSGGGAYGIQLYAFTGATGNSVGTLSCNTIASNLGSGIQLADDDPMDAFVPTVSGSNNAISGNGTGAENTTAATQNLENNYWGSGTGPNPPGSGDTLVGPVDAVPFLTLVAPCIACTTNLDCQNGLVCDGAETCSAGACQAGSPVICTPTQCEASSLCQEPSGMCVTTPKPNGVLCNDGAACTVGDTCQGGVCTPGPGADTDNDGDCDDQEAACGCNGMDGSEVCILPNRLVGLPGSGVGEVLLNWHTPIVRKVPVATDPSCATAGVCSAGRCTAGQINDICTVNADCNLPASTCRIIVNYADTADLTLDFARVNRTSVAGLFTPPAPGCSRKVDVPLDGSRISNRLRLKATGTIDNRTRRDRDTLVYR
jgi:nitrous oxidase accessory protein NosD